jgi:hypothetical protein
LILRPPSLGGDHAAESVLVFGPPMGAYRAIFCRRMAIAKCIGRLRWAGFYERIIRLRQIDAEIVESDFLTANISIRFAKIRLGVTWPVAHRYEHLARAQCRRSHILGKRQLTSAL